MRRELHYFDIYPKVVLEGFPTAITVKPLGRHAAFTDGRPYKITVIPMLEPLGYGSGRSYDTFEATAEKNELKFSYTFRNEQEFTVRVFVNDRDEYIRLAVYAVRGDLFERMPLKGDLHVHTTWSDGGESPEIAAAYYRKAGYDFMVISDHYEYGGSVAGREFYRDTAVDLNIINGEEIHAPGNSIHIVNFGGEFSVNDLYRRDEEGYYREVNALAGSLELPDGINRFEYASCLWVYNHIRRGRGLAIYAHPYWIVDSYNVGDAMTLLQFKNRLFDAFELVGGLSPKENDMQLALYHTAIAGGTENFPIVGSSDSHGTVREPFEGSSFSNPVTNAYGFDEFKTIVFAKSNDKDEIIAAIKAGYSVAVDEYKGAAPRVHGDYRLVSYALFLLSEYFPLHDELCFEEGRLMKAFAAGIEADAEENLERLAGRTGRLADKYFAIRQAGR